MSLSQAKVANDNRFQQCIASLPPRAGASKPMGGAGACIAAFIVPEAQRGLLGKVTCSDGELCVPCVSPIDQMRTGACDEKIQGSGNSWSTLVSDRSPARVSA
jgi:hypothetical protein